jgi:hypothetical protein
MDTVGNIYHKIFVDRSVLEKIRVYVQLPYVYLVYYNPVFLVEF